MTVSIKKFSRLAVYAFFLSLTALLSPLLGLFGGKKFQLNQSEGGLIPMVPTAHADVPAPPTDTGDLGGGADGCSDSGCAGGGCCSAGDCSGDSCCGDSAA